MTIKVGMFQLRDRKTCQNVFGDATKDRVTVEEGRSFKVCPARGQRYDTARQ